MRVPWAEATAQPACAALASWGQKTWPRQQAVPTVCLKANGLVGDRAVYP